MFNLLLSLLVVLVSGKIACIVGEHYGKLAAQSEKPSEWMTKKAFWIGCKGFLLVAVLWGMLMHVVHDLLKFT